ncbi:MAG: hypothetical protein AAF368_16410, partial [Planctomycetota bacterium]
QTKRRLEEQFWVDFAKRGLDWDEASGSVRLNGRAQLKRNRLSERIPEEIMTAVSLYACFAGCPLALGDLPDIVHRERVCNALTVAQMKEVLKQCSFALGRSPELSPRFPVSVCYNNVHPVGGQGGGWGNPFFDAFTPINDLHVAMLVAHWALRGVSRLKPARGRRAKPRILVLATPGANEGIRHFLDSIDRGQVPRGLLAGKSGHDALHLGDLLAVPEPVKNMFGKAYIEELVEKAAIWDVLLDPYKPSFANSTAIVQKYLSEQDYPVLAAEEVERQKQRIRQAMRQRDIFDNRDLTRELSYSEKFDELEHLYQNLFIEYQKLFFRMLGQGKLGLESSFYREALKTV